jgi:hypothetical protein
MLRHMGKFKYKHTRVDALSGNGNQEYSEQQSEVKQNTAGIFCIWYWELNPEPHD